MGPVFTFVSTVAWGVNCHQCTTFLSGNNTAPQNSIYQLSAEPTHFAVITPQMVNNLQKMYLIQQLSDNWNGYNAKAFSSELINKVQKYIFQLERQPSIFPTGRDSIQLEYEKENGDYLEFEVFSEKIIMLMIVGSDEVEIEIDEKQIPKMVDEFYGRV